MKKKNEKKIIFVCTGNTCRSPMAEALLKDALQKANLGGFSVSSAGIAAHNGDTINPKSAFVLSENGLATEEFSSTLLEENVLKEAFAVICMTENQKDILLDMRWQALRKADEIGEEEIENNIYSFAELAGYEIIDPYGKDIECYRYVYKLLSSGMIEIIQALRLADYAKKPRKCTTAKTENATPKKRGRPKKQVGEQPPKTPKKRGRPKKNADVIRSEIQ